METTYNRESWLTAFAEKVTPLIRERTGLNPKNLRIACGWPSRGGTGLKNRTIGQCYVSGSTAGKAEIFISPVLDEAAEVAHVTVHEMLHAALPKGTGHRKPFSQAAKRMGLEGKPTATTASDELAKALKAITDELGSYPHNRIALDGMPKQTTRLIKVMCPVCGFIARVTRTPLEEVGAPICGGCNVEMEEADAGEEAATPLVVAEQTVEYHVKPDDTTVNKYRHLKIQVKHDPRWSVRMTRKGREVQWSVIDYGDEALGVPIPRLTPAESRQEALDLIDSLRVGLLTYDDLADEVPDVDDDFEGEADPEADWNDVRFLDDDEDEDPDFEDGIVSDEEEAAFVAEQEKREAIAVDACSTKSTSVRIERETGSWQYRYEI